MQWKEIFKVSAINSVIIIILFYVVNMMWGFGDIMTATFSMGSMAVGLLATGLILHKKLKDEKGILIGLIITWLLALIILGILDLTGLVFSSQFWVRVIS